MMQRYTIKTIPTEDFPYHLWGESLKKTAEAILEEYCERISLAGSHHIVYVVAFRDFSISMC